MLDQRRRRWYSIDPASAWEAPCGYNTRQFMHFRFWGVGSHRRSYCWCGLSGAGLVADHSPWSFYPPPPVGLTYHIITVVIRIPVEGGTPAVFYFALINQPGSIICGRIQRNWRTISGEWSRKSGCVCVLEGVAWPGGHLALLLCAPCYVTGDPWGNHGARVTLGCGPVPRVEAAPHYAVLRSLRWALRHLDDVSSAATTAHRRAAGGPPVGRRRGLTTRVLGHPHWPRCPRVTADGPGVPPATPGAPRAAPGPARVSSLPLNPGKQTPAAISAPYYHLHCLSGASQGQRPVYSLCQDPGRGGRAGELGAATRARLPTGPGPGGRGGGWLGDVYLDPGSRILRSWQPVVLESPLVFTTVHPCHITHIFYL